MVKIKKEFCPHYKRDGESCKNNSAVYYDCDNCEHYKTKGKKKNDK